MTIYAVTLTKTAISKESIGLFGRYTNSDVVIQGHLDEISTLHLKISLIVTDQLAESTRWPVYDFTFSCSSTFSHEVREKIFTNYWSIGDKREQRLFILKHVERHLANRKRVGSDKRNVTFKYYLYTGDSRLQVCRHFFLNTLDVGRDFIYGTMDMHSATGTLKPTKQGAHSNHVNTDETLLKEVKDHISSFAVIDSHYCRAKSLKKYLDSSFSVSKMYKMYTEACRGPNKLSEFKHRQVFDTFFNLGFHRPKKDQCEICVAFRNTIDHSEKDKDTYTEHQNNEQKARDIKDRAKAESTVPEKNQLLF